MRGKSISRVAEKMNEVGIEADYYVAACEENFENEFINRNNISIKAYVVYSQRDIYCFSGLITQYIEASMRTFNVDSPIYDINCSKQTIEYILNATGAITLTSGLQAQYGIMSKSVYFSHMPKNESKTLLDKVLIESILKVRFYYDDSRIIAVPFVLLPDCDLLDLDNIYHCLFSTELDNLIMSDNERRVMENKYKLISYFLSDALFCLFANQHNLEFSRNVLNDITQFDKSLDEIISINTKNDLLVLMSNVKVCEISFSSFMFTNYVRCAYQFVSNWNPALQIYEDYNGLIFGINEPETDGKLNRIAFAYQDLYEWTEARNPENPNNKFYVSSVIDIFVDMGFIVPAILHTSTKHSAANKILRAYKLGEYSKLTREQIDAFVRMLFSYQNSVKRKLDRTEFEKLCVLFFKTCIFNKNKCFDLITKFEDGAYGIAYSYYGPRLVSTETVYSVPSESDAISNLIDDSILTTTGVDDKYDVRYDRNVKDRLMNLYCLNFATGYAKVNKVFSSYRYIPSRPQGPYSQNVHSLDQFLTLLAIGNNVTNRIYSLCAEIYFVAQLKEEMFFGNLSDEKISGYKGFLKGINSGLWKYKCYKEDALNTTMEKIVEIDNEAGYFPMQVMFDEGDTSKLAYAYLDECGNFLFKAAYILNTLIERTNRADIFNIDDEIQTQSANKSDSKPKTVFKRGIYYYDKKTELRKRMTSTLQKAFEDRDEESVIRGSLSSLQKEARLLLDKCDLYIETKDTIGSYVKDYLVINSENGSLPEQFNLVLPCFLNGVSKAKTTVVIPILSPNMLSTVVSNAIKETLSVGDCEYILVNNVSGKYSMFVLADNKAKGSNIIDEIYTLKRHVHNKPKAGKHLFIYQSDSNIYLNLGKVSLTWIETENYNERGKIVNYLIDYEENGNAMIININHADNVNNIDNVNNLNYTNGDNRGSTTEINVMGDANVGGINTGEVHGDVTITLDESEKNDCRKLIDEAEARIMKDAALSKEQVTLINESLASIRDELKNEKQSKSKLAKIWETMKTIAGDIKGVAECAAAIIAIVEFLSPLL